MLSIIVPTYTEAVNLPALAEGLDRELRTRHIDYELLIVDDNSPDNTTEVCEQLAVTYPLRLLQPKGRPRDLSLSVIDGINAARNDLVLVMDADLSHPPARVPVMLEALQQAPAAVVVGSRYVSGGSFDRHWSIWRFLNSHLATLLAVPLVRCSDPMSGFFAFDRRHLGDTSRLKAVGYKIGLEIMVRGDFLGVVEVPIEFKDRELGNSKMTLGQQFKYLRHLRRLYLYKFARLTEFVHFGVVGSSGLLIDVLFYYGLQLLGMPHQWARGLAFLPAVSWNWLLNRQTTFSERVKRPALSQWLAFVSASAIGFSCNWSLYVLLTSQIAFFDEHRFVALLLGVASGSLFNFAASTWFVYSEKRADKHPES
jgi:dolichol-phosphate mannosyltransferase